MKYTILLMSLLFSSSVALSQDDDKENHHKLARINSPRRRELECAMTGIHTKTFSPENIYAAPLNVEYVKEWNKIIASTHDLVVKYRDTVVDLRNSNKVIKKNWQQSHSKQRNETLMDKYNRIKNANDDLVEMINEVYAKRVKSPTPNDDLSFALSSMGYTLRATREQLIREYSLQFKAINVAMRGLSCFLKADQKSLKNEIERTEHTQKTLLQKQQAIVLVLYRLALTVATTAKKAQNDLEKIKNDLP